MTDSYISMIILDNWSLNQQCTTVMWSTLAHRRALTVVAVVTMLTAVTVVAVVTIDTVVTVVMEMAAVIVQ